MNPFIIIPKVQIFIKTSKVTTLKVSPANENIEIFVSKDVNWNHIWGDLKKQLFNLDVSLQKCGENLLAKITTSNKTIFSGLISRCRDNPNQFQLTEISIYTRFQDMQISEFVLSAPNMNFHKFLRAKNLCLISTQGCISFNATVSCTDKIEFIAEKNNIYFNTETGIKAAEIKVSTVNMFLDGKFVGENLNVDFDIAHLFIGIHGKIGRPIDDKKPISQNISGRITGTVYNFGEIVSQNKVDLYFNDIKSLIFNDKDTAIRGYEAIKSLFRIEEDGVKNSDVLLKTVDKLVGEMNEKQQKAAVVTSQNELTKQRDDENYKLAALREKQKWRRGIIQSDMVVLNVTENLEDCAQIFGQLIDITVGKNAICEMDSIWNNSNSELILKAQNWFIHGHVHFYEVQVVNLTNKFAAFPSSFFKIGNSMYINAKDFDNGGILQITQKLEMNILNMAKFHKKSTTTTTFLKMQVGSLAENDVTSLIKCENGDITVVEKFINNGTFEASKNLKVVSKYLLNTGLTSVGEKLVINPVYLKSDEWDSIIENAPKGIMKCKNGQCLTKSFNNAGLFNVIENMELSTEHMSQKDSGRINVGEKFELKACFAKNGEWNGMIEAKDFVLLVIGDLEFCGQIHARNASITLLSPETSIFTIHGLLNFSESILYIDYLNVEDSSIYPSFILSGQVYAQAIYANPVYIQLLNSAQMFLTKNVDAKNLKEEMMICAKVLETRKEAIILSEILNDCPQIFQCKKILHNGILVESSTKVIFDVEEMIHNGKLYYGNKEKQFECLLDASIFVKKQIENHAEILAKHLEILGKGILKNFNKIEGDRINIVLDQICNKDGKIFGNDISAKVTTEKEVIIDGNLFSENNLAIIAQNAEVLIFKCFSHESDESNYFVLPSKIKYMLAKNIEIHSNVRYSNLKNIKTTMISESSVKFLGECYYTFLDFKIQNPQPIPVASIIELFEMNIEKNAKLSCSTLQISGEDLCYAMPEFEYLWSASRNKRN